MMKKSHEASQTHLEGTYAMEHMNLSRDASRKRKLAVQQASIDSSASKTKACKAVQMYTLTSLDDIKQVDLREDLAADGEVAGRPGG